MAMTAEQDDEAIEQTLRATLTPRAALTAADRARRSTLLRRPGAGKLAGVCAAIAASAGVPARMVRLLGLLAGLLGVGVPAYLIAMLLIPRLRPDRDGAAEGVTVQRPLEALISFEARPVDVLALLAVVPSLAGTFWMMFVLARFSAAAAVLVALTVIVLALLLLSVRRAAEARRGLLLAALARRAELVDLDQLEAFLREQRRRAPAAWTVLAGEGKLPGFPAESLGGAGGGAHADGAVFEGGAADGGITGETAEDLPRTPLRVHSRSRRTVPRRPAATIRTVIAVLAGMLAAAALTVLTLNLAPELAPTLAAAGPLPQVGRLAAGLGAATLVAGLALVILGLRGRRSVVLALAALLALGGTGLGGAWLRLTYDPQAVPLQIIAADLEAGRHLSCPSDPGSWAQPLIIDLRGLDAAAAEKLREQQRSHGIGEEGPVTSVGCTRPVGDLTVMLPSDPELVRVWVGTTDGMVEGGAARGAVPVVDVWGDVLVGTVTIIEQPSTAENGDEA
ncbi:hypothetical protein GCM10023160_31770 [Brachybacterium paraconglomeratum]|uniref:PspC domain-containing protein n=1 Tax=Brachybacterium paraconglomeratum TaxID=173362 RepID=UPI0031E7766F